MPERRYRITVEVNVADDIVGGTYSHLIGIVAQAIEDADLRPSLLSIEEAPDYV